MTIELGHGGTRRWRRRVALAVAAATSAAALALTPQAHSQVPLVCSTPGSTAPIGPNVSGEATLAPGETTEWTGPCGTTSTLRLTDWYDHYYVTFSERSELRAEIEWGDPTDVFDLFVYRGTVAKERPAHQVPACGSSADREAACEMARDQQTLAVQDSGWPPSLRRKSIEFGNVEPGPYTIRVIYRNVVEGDYTGVVRSVPLPPALLAPPDQEPPPRASYETVDDPYREFQWGLDRIKTPEAWQLQQATGHGITIAVVDTGVDLRHPDFSCPGKLLVLEGATIGSTEPPQDRNGHGTHVAGIAAACGNNGEGVVGVAPDARVMPVNAYDAIISGPGPDVADEGFAAGINFAVDNGAHVINLSMGVNPPLGYAAQLYEETETALARAREEGVVVVAAAGNFDPQQVAAPSPFCGYPSLSRHVLCVGATDRNDELAYYSYFPNQLEEGEGDRPAAGVVAPGGAGRACSATERHGIVSAYLFDEGEEPNCGYGAGYRELDGTSMASPHVAGLATLLYDRLAGKRSAHNADLIIDTIIRTADISPAADGEGEPDYEYDPVYGHGLIDAVAAVEAIAPVVTIQPSALTLYVDGPGSSRSALVATLIDGDSGAGLSDQPIEFFADGMSLGWATTDASGVASIPLDGRFRGARHYFEGVFAGNEQYHGSSGSIQT